MITHGLQSNISDDNDSVKQSSLLNPLLDFHSEKK